MVPQGESVDRTTLTREVTMPRALRRPRLLGAACLVLLLAAVTGCHKLRSQLGGGSAAPDAAAGADSSAKPKHLRFGGGGKKSRPAAVGPISPESREPSEAALARHSRRTSWPMFHWNEGAAGDHHHKSTPGN